MRTVTAGEQTVLEGAHLATFARVLVEDADGTYQDLTDQDSLDWVDSGRIAQTIDQIVATGQFTFWRSQEGGNSLAPLDEDSLLNRNSVPAYAPLIDVGRGIRCEFATMAIGSSPSAGDWQRVFQGVIDQWTVKNDFVNVLARDAIGAEIADSFIEAETVYGTGPGRALEDVMQDILTAWTGLTLYTPVSPSFNVTTYNQQRVSVLEALQQLAGLIGWVIQPRWDDGTSAFRLEFYEPDRAPVSTDWTWAANRYEAVPDFTLSRLDIRNALSLWYTNTSGVRSQVTASDATSITKYDRQWMEIEEPSDSPIDTSTEAQDMIDGALLDLKDPIAGQEVKTLCFWPVQLSDYFQFNANAVHYTVNQAFGITGFRHEFSGGQVDTYLLTRGKPAGFIRPWLARGGGNAKIRTDASEALANSETAQITADGKVTTFIQASAPTAEGTGDLWIDSDDGNKLYRWSGSAWVEVQDADVAQGISDAASAQSTADGRNTMFRQTSAPTANATGDLWFDSDDDDRPHRWSGSSWVDIGDVTDSRINVASLSAINADLGTVTAGQLNAAVVVAADSFTASVATFDGKVTINGTDAGDALTVVESGGTSGGIIASLQNSHASSPFGVKIHFTGASPDDNTDWFFRCQDTTTNRLWIYSDGDVLNHDGTYGTISDRRIKQGIMAARSQRDDIVALAALAVNYRHRDEVDAKGDAAKELLGWVADDVMETMPGLVVHGPDGLLAFKQSIAHNKALIALGEAFAEIDGLRARIEILETAAI